MFELQAHQAKLNNVNARAEKHGEERIPAFDLKFLVVCDGKALHEFSHELHKMLYVTHQDLAGEIYATRFPQMGPIDWDWAGVGYTARLAYGMNEESDIVLRECELDKFTFTPLNGGSVEIAFRIVCHPDKADVGRVCEFIQRDACLSLQAPGVEELFKTKSEEEIA